MKMKRILFISALWCGSPSAAEQAPIPEPLTLKQALTFTEAAHPSLQIANSVLNSAEADLGKVRSSQAMTVGLDGRIRWKGLQQNPGERRNDHQLALVARKPLYDFGRSERAEAAAEQAVKQKSVAYRAAQVEKRLEIMERFFAVLLADLQRTVEDETMTIAYLRFKKKEDKEITGEYSELDLLQGESRFQDARAKQKQSEMAQRVTRMQLAEAMNRPGAAPSTLIAPAITPDQLQQSLKPLDELQQLAEQGNRVLIQAQQQVEMAQHKLEQARLGNRPELDASFEVLDHALVTSSKDRWRASLLLEMPLLDGGANGQEVAAARGVLSTARARLEQTRRQVREEISHRYLELQALDAQWRADQIAAEYYEIELERSRALYEQEQQSNFGDALVGISKSHLRTAESRFRAMLIRARLEQLTGEEITVYE